MMLMEGRNSSAGEREKHKEDYTCYSTVIGNTEDLPLYRPGLYHRQSSFSDRYRPNDPPLHRRNTKTETGAKTREILLSATPFTDHLRRSARSIGRPTSCYRRRSSDRNWSPLSLSLSGLLLVSSSIFSILIIIDTQIYK